jgi:hypothetical protein
MDDEDEVLSRGNDTTIVQLEACIPRYDSVRVRLLLGLLQRGLDRQGFEIQERQFHMSDPLAERDASNKESRRRI